jgi:TetR/AcrR family transcriptional regulator
MTRPATRDPEATRASILDAAFRLFVEKGFADTAVSEIARAAGVTQSLIHHHFGSKQELWQAVALACANEFNRMQDELQERTRGLTGMALLETRMRLFFHFLRGRPDLVRLFLWMALERPFKVDHEEIPAAKEGRDLIVSLQQQGVLRSDIRPEHVMVMMQSFLIHWMHVRQDMVPWMHREDAAVDVEKADEAYLDATLKVFLAGLAARS